ncbi:MAG: two-component sensor histidine kinase [Deltaproteobacteria bacterium]|nr:two-component sensor histidine kinase [Deltaproteobacteria bacterium]
MKPKEKSENVYYQSLGRKVILQITIMSLIPIFIVSCIILVQFQKANHKKVHAHLIELVLKHKQNIDGFLTEKLNDIQMVSKLFSYVELSNESFLENKLAVLRQGFDADFVDLGVIDDQGLQVAYAGPFKLLKADYSKAEWFINAVQNQYFISDVFLGLRDHPHFIITVRQKWEGRYWILRATIDFNAFNSLVENLRIGKTGFAFIINKKGDFQTKSFFDSIASKENILNFLKCCVKSERKEYVFERTDDSGTDKIYVASFLKNGDWILLYQQNARDAFSDFNHARNIAVMLILVTVLCVILYAVLFSKNVIRRIRKSDTESHAMNEQVIETGKLATVGELAAGIAHEINNPVAIMVEEAGWIEDLLEEEEFEKSENFDEFQRALKQINTQGKRCKEITHKLLSFARKTDSRITEMQINDLLEDMVALSAQRAKYSNVEINTTFDNNLPEIRLSHSEMQQVFLNLINNALDAMEDKGGILNIESRLADDYIEIKIADSGTGIPAANLARIFDPFFTTKPVGKGTGLGLSICYGIVKKMGGDIKTESLIDVGTTFKIKLPFNKKTVV